MENPRITAIEWGTLEGSRPRKAGCNARLGEHGQRVQVPLLRLTTEDGSRGFGFCRAGQGEAAILLGMRLNDLYLPEGGVLSDWRAFEYPLWDLLGQRAGKPIYSLAADLVGAAVTNPFTAPCYDTSLYFDDLHLPTDQEAAHLLADEARQGFERGHRAFKIKVGRGARHLPLDEGTRRDIAVVLAVRQAVGPTCPLMLDANNGYNLNLTKEVLTKTADCDIFWIEEAFHEDPVLYRELRVWLNAQELPVLIADGEGDASANLLSWAEQGIIDVVQYDIFSYGFTRWLQTGRQLDAWGVRAAPHHYGRHYGNYIACHLAAAIKNFTFVEWDEVATPGLDGSAYTITEGRVSVPDAPGFGLLLDETRFLQAVQANGFTLP